MHESVCVCVCVHVRTHTRMDMHTCMPLGERESMFQGIGKTYANTLYVWKIIQFRQEVKFYGGVVGKEAIEVGKEQIILKDLATLRNYIFIL